MNPTPSRAPGPRGNWLLGNLPDFRRDVLGLMRQSAADFGDVVRFRLGPQIVHLLNHPDHVRHVLQTHHQNFDKRTRSAGFIKSVTGDSLLTSNGEFWQRQRRLAQPAFHRQHLVGYARQMTTATTELVQRWQARSDATAPLDIAREMMRLTFTIVGRTLFSTDVGTDADTLERAMAVILPHTFGRLGRIFNWPDWAPTPTNRRFQAALRDVNEVVYRIIAEHRRRATDAAPDRDLLDTLMRVRDGETGVGFTDEQLRNETVTFLLAGHETTANALTWTFHLLSEHPEVATRLRGEIREALGNRVPTLEDLPRLTGVKHVLQESMRLFPPIWIIERRVVSEDEVGGFRLSAGSTVVLAPYVLHRHPKFWDQPERFDPTRFAHSVPEAYLPFGAGPRFCIGSEFAMLEAQLILSQILQTYQLRRQPGHPVEPLPGITLRTRHGLPMTLHR